MQLYIRGAWRTFSIGGTKGPRIDAEAQRIASPEMHRDKKFEQANNISKQNTGHSVASFPHIAVKEDLPQREALRAPSKDRSPDAHGGRQSNLVMDDKQSITFQNKIDEHLGQTKGRCEVTSLNCESMEELCSYYHRLRSNQILPVDTLLGEGEVVMLFEDPAGKIIKLSVPVPNTLEIFGIGSDFEHVGGLIHIEHEALWGAYQSRYETVGSDNQRHTKGMMADVKLEPVATE